MIAQAFITRRNLVLTGIFLFFVLGVALFLTYTYLHTPQAAWDDTLIKTFAAVDKVHSYSQKVDTRAVISGRELSITGIYTVDNPGKSFASFSTTTLSIPGDKKKHVFSHQNIAIGPDIYVRLYTTDQLLASSIRSSPQWRHFQANKIPPDFANVAIPGPIQDNISLLENDGEWLTLRKKDGIEKWGDDDLLRYTFALSHASPPPNTTVSALEERITPSGSVEIWIDPSTYLPKYMVFMSEGYISTTTLSSFDDSFPLTIPQGQ